MHAIAHALGLDNASGAWYLAWSGFVGDLGMVGAIAVYARSRQCHVKGCWRIARHEVEGTPYRTCARHHPAVPDKPSVEEIHAAHRRARR